MRRVLFLGLLGLAACLRLDLGRRVSDDELRLRRELEGYYLEAAAAFAAASPDALAALFDPAIKKPMTQERIRAWAEAFFREHGPAKLRVEALEFERVGFESAVVRVRYRVDTADGKGAFAASERDEFAKKRGKWLITGWEKLSSQ